MPSLTKHVWRTPWRAAAGFNRQSPSRLVAWLPWAGISLALALPAATITPPPTSPSPTAGFAVLPDDPGPWSQILSSVGFHSQPPDSAGILVIRPGAAAPAQLTERVEQGAFLILEGQTTPAESFGFRAGHDTVSVVNVEDVHRPKLPIIWQKAIELHRFEVPKNAQVFAKERWSGAPLIAGFSSGRGAVLWIAASPGDRGYERFPYILQALTDLGLGAPFRSARLWAFFDSAYRARVDLDYFAARWRASGIAALQVASWHYYDPDPERDHYLKALIEACHRHGILVYAWIEIPHVSGNFGPCIPSGVKRPHYCRTRSSTGASS